MLTFLLSPWNLPTFVTWKAFVACLPRGRPPAITIQSCISMHVIKHSFHLISASLTNIIYLSLQKGIFLDKLKLTKVIPMYKTNDPSLFTNYRPISLLSNFSKFWEKQRSKLIFSISRLLATFTFKMVADGKFRSPKIVVSLTQDTSCYLHEGATAERCVRK